MPGNGSAKGEDKADDDSYTSTASCGSTSSSSSDQQYYLQHIRAEFKDATPGKKRPLLAALLGRSKDSDLARRKKLRKGKGVGDVKDSKDKSGRVEGQNAEAEVAVNESKEKSGKVKGQNAEAEVAVKESKEKSAKVEGQNAEAEVVGGKESKEDSKEEKACKITISAGNGHVSHIRVSAGATVEIHFV